MAVTSKVLIESKTMEAALTTQYTAVNSTAIIDKFTATNVTAANATIDIHLVPAGGAANATNLIVDGRIVAAGETYTFPAIVGHGLASGGFIATTGTAASLVIRAQGREIS
jgi:hypothetical protein